jgi:hypothetical protein
MNEKAIICAPLAYRFFTFPGLRPTGLFAAVFNPPTPQALGVPVTQAAAAMMTLTTILAL